MHYYEHEPASNFSLLLSAPTARRQSRFWVARLHVRVQRLAWLGTLPQGQKAHQLSSLLSSTVQVRIYSLNWTITGSMVTYIEREIFKIWSCFGKVSWERKGSEEVGGQKCIMHLFHLDSLIILFNDLQWLYSHRLHYVERLAAYRRFPCTFCRSNDYQERLQN